VALILSGCSAGEYGVIELSVTDAPIIDEDSITGVYVTFDEVQYNNGSGWESTILYSSPAELTAATKRRRTSRSGCLKTGPFP
jgi:hypothetical protein